MSILWPKVVCRVFIFTTKYGDWILQVQAVNTSDNYTVYGCELITLSTVVNHNSQDLINSNADPFTPRSTRNLESTYVPHTNFDRSNISGGT